MRKVSGATDVQVDQVTGMPQLLIKIDRQAIARYGVNVQDVQEVIRAAVGGEVSGQIYEGIRRFDIFVRFSPDYRSTLEDIKELLITTSSGMNVPLAPLAEIKEIIGPRQITREDNQRFITIQCNVTDRDIVGFVEEEQMAIDESVKLPPGYMLCGVDSLGFNKRPIDDFLL